MDGLCCSSSSSYFIVGLDSASRPWFLPWTRLRRFVRLEVGGNECVCITDDDPQNYYREVHDICDLLHRDANCSLDSGSVLFCQRLDVLCRGSGAQWTSDNVYHRFIVTHCDFRSAYSVALAPIRHLFCLHMAEIYKVEHFEICVSCIGPMHL